LSLVRSTVTNGLPLIVGDGAQPAALALRLGGTNEFPEGLIVTNGARLTGTGTIRSSARVYGTVDPGASNQMGSLSIQGDLELTNTATVMIDMAAETTPGVGWDLLSVTNGILKLGGQLRPALAEEFTPTNTFTFVVLTNKGPGSIVGVFDNAGQGSRIPVFAIGGHQPLGMFTVSISAQSVMLTDFVAALNPRGQF